MSSVFHTIPLDAQQAGLPPCSVCGSPGVVWQADARVHCPQCLFGCMTDDGHVGAPDPQVHPRFAVLMDLLPSAVCLYIAQLQVLDATNFQVRFREWTDSDALEADGLFSEVLTAGAGKKGDGARAFNALARSLAALAFVPGGVPFGNKRWEAQRGDERNADATTTND